MQGGHLRALSRSGILAATVALVAACDTPDWLRLPGAPAMVARHSATPGDTLDALEALARTATADPAADASKPPPFASLLAAYWTGDFERLERELAPLLARFEQTGSAAADDHLHRIVDGLADRPQAYTVAQRWVAAYPRSYLAHAVLGHALLSEGARARGTKFAAETPRENFDALRDHVSRAVPALQAAARLSPRPVLAVRGFSSAELYEGNRATRERLERVGLALSPHSHWHWWGGMTERLPQWGGSIEAMQAWVGQARAAGAPDRVLRDLSARVVLAQTRDERQRNQRAVPAVMERLATEFDRPWLWKSYGDALSNAARPDEALQAYARAIDSAPDDHIEARYWRARLLLGMGRTSEGLPDMERAARGGWASAQQWLIDAHAYGNRGLPRDLDKLRPWCELAAVHGNGWGDFCLGGLYFDALAGFPRDQALALRYFEIAARKGHPVAQHDYGWMLVQGRGVPADREAGVRWLRAAAAQGSDVAKDKLRSLGINPETPSTADRGSSKRGYLAAAVGAGSVALVILLNVLALGHREPRIVDGRSVLYFGTAARLILVASFGLGLAMLWLAWSLPLRTQWIAYAFATVFTLLGVASLYLAFLVRISFDQRGIEYRSPLAGTRNVAWADLRSAGWVNLLQMNYLVPATGRRLWLSPWMNGYRALGEQVERALTLRAEQMRSPVPVSQQAGE